MSLPAGHAMAGLVVYAAFREEGAPIRWPEVLLAALLPVLPDVDFLVEWVLGVPAAVCRRSFTHSIPTALAAAFLLDRLGVAKRMGKTVANPLYLFLLIASHGVVDFFGGPNPAPPSGVAFLSPFSGARWTFPRAVLPSVPIPVRQPMILLQHWPAFLKTCCVEALYFVPLLAAVFLIRRRASVIQPLGA